MTKERELLRRALEAAREWIGNSPHGDNCFLHDDGWYNQCFCGKDSIENHIDEILSDQSSCIENAKNSTPSDDAKEPTPVAWRYKEDPSDLRSRWLYATKEKWIPKGFPYQPLYLHPPKPAEPEAGIIEKLKAENFKLASGQCTEGGPWGDEGGTPYCKYAARKPMTEEELDRLLDDPNFRPEVKPLFIAGIRFAEKHHNIRGSDE